MTTFSKQTARRFWRVWPVLTLVLALTGQVQAACDTSICVGGATACTISGTHTIDSGCTLNFGSKDVTLTGTLQGDNNAACYTVQADDLIVRGTLRARSSCVNVNITGNFSTVVVSNSPATVDVRNADNSGDGVFVTCGSATLNGKDINADADNFFGAPHFWFPAGDIVITCSGNITGTGGPFHAVANNGDDGGDIEITSTGGLINLASVFDVSGGGDFSFGGSITLDASGDVTAGTSARALRANPAQGGSAGSVDIISGGTASVNGPINVNGSGEDSDGGDITVSGSAVTTGTVWNSNGDNGGWGGFITVSALTGAGTISTTAGAGSWNANGGAAGDYGGDGGFIDVSAVGDVDLDGDMDAAGNGEGAWGGEITISTDGDIITAGTSRLEADSAGTDAEDGAISLTACSMNLSGDIDTRNTNLASGYNTFDYAGTLTQNGGSNILADADGGNDVYCRCVDVADPIGTCDTPLACVSDPDFNGTVTPAASVNPIPMASCG